MTKKETSLADWINQRGVTNVAKLLKVNNSTVRHWKAGNVLPGPEKMLAIENLGKGKITVSGIVRTYFADPSNKGKWKTT